MVGRQMQQLPGLLKQRDSQYLKGWYFEDEMLFPGQGRIYSWGFKDEEHKCRKVF